MFKKKKKDKQKTLDDKNQKNKNGSSSKIGSNQLDLDDDVDGFDKNGFVDLQPIESDATVLGPRQRCTYIGTFAVVSGTDGQKTLKTHKERTTFVKDKLSDYRDKQNGVDVVLQISSDGIKVFNADASRVRMAYPLQRISFATCDPDFFLFAFMTYSPTPDGVAVHAHVFIGQSSKQVQDLTAMIGKSFKMAFASSKLQKRHGMNTGDIVPRQDTPVRRWAKHEINRGHEHSEHASYAKKKVLQTTASNSSGSGTDESPVLEKKAAKPGWRNGSPTITPPTQRKHKGLSSRFSGDDDAFCDSVSEQLSISSKSTNVTTTTTTLESQTTVTMETSVTHQEALSRLPYSPHKELDISDHYAGAKDNEKVETNTETEEAPPIPPRTHVEKSLSDPVVTTSSTLQPEEGGPSDARVTYVGSDDQNTEAKKRSNTIDRPVTHHDEYWYMPGIPREFILEMLASSEDGSFFVRDSQSRPGCHALTVRVPKDFIPDGYANYLITSVPEGVKLEGFSKVFPDLMTLIEHYACQADELPCKLTLAGSNMLCDNEEQDFMEPVDPDYQMLSDFHSMMDELKH